MRSILHSTSYDLTRSTSAVRTQIAFGFLTFILLLLGAGASAQTQEGCNPSLFELICPENAELDCADGTDPLVAGMPGVIYDEFCFEEPIVNFSDVQTSAEGDCPVVIERTWTATYLDQVAMCTQLIVVNDTEGPELLDFVEEISVQCTEEVPAPADYTAVDACSGMEVDVEIFESQTGALISSCDLSTAMGIGNDWALWLPTLANEGEVSSDSFNFDENGGTFDQFDDGTAHLYGTVVNDSNPSEIFVLDLWFDNASDWTDWSSMGRSYKDDLGCAQPDLYESWTYYTMVDEFSTATGQGDLAGDVLYFFHMPADYYYGFQIGMGANNKNCDFGLSGWFTYEGIVDGQAVNGNGDVNVDATCTTIPLSDCPNETEFSYFYRAVDNCGNVTLAEQTITVLDDQGPEFLDFPADVTINCEEYPLEIPVLEAVDNCAGEVTITGPFVDEIPGACANAFTVTVAWSAEDDCENQTNMIWTITVVDVEAPVLEGLPENTTAECDDVPAPAVVTATDNCSDNVEVSFEENQEPGNCDGQYWIYRTWTATDECGNTSSYTQEIAVQDTTAPVFDEYDYETEVECDGAEDIMLTAQDNCSDVTVEITTEMLLSGACLGTIYRVYTATDDCGNSSEAVQYILLVDTTAPEIVGVMDDTTLECSDVEAGEDFIFGAGDVYGEDNCGLDVTIDYAEEVIPGDCENAYTVIRTWTATDFCENVSTASQTVTVEDNTNPEFTSFPEDTSVECSDELPEVVYPTALDNCDDEVEIELTIETEEGTCEGESTLLRIFRAFDNCGNEVMGVQTISIVDTTPPVFTMVPAAATYECDEEILVDEASAEDNCGSVTITHSDGVSMPGQCADAYSFIRTYTATDDCGNSSTAEQLISVEDTTPPVITAETFLQLPCDMVSEEVFATAEDNCDTDVEITFTQTTVSGGCAGNIIRLYTATDNCGNSSTFEQTISLTDDVAPDWTAFPLDTEASCDDLPEVSQQVDAEDNCDDEVVIAYLGETITPGDCAGNYTLVRTWSATDACGNSVERSQTISVYDNTAPEFTFVPGDLTYECDEEVAEELATAEDNCGTVEVTFSDEMEAGDCEGNYQIIRTFTATDDCGNAATASQTITIEDTTAPEFTFVPETSTFECGDEIAVEDATAEDNCGPVSISFEDYYTNTPWVATTLGNGSVDLEELPSTITLTGSDLSDTEGPWLSIASTLVKNTIVSFDWSFDGEPVTVITGPEFDPFGYSVNGVFTQLTDDDGPEVQSGSATVELNAGDTFELLVEASDDIEGAGIAEITNISFEINNECPVVECFIRQYTATDDCGNAATAETFVIVEDTTAPEITGDLQLEMPCDEIDQGIFVEASDVCSEVQITFEDQTFSGGCEGVITRTYTATDACGNASTFEQIINLTDDVAPLLEVAEDETIECDEEIPAADWTASDNCDEELTEVIEEVVVPGNCPNNYSIERTYTVTDNCGNSTSATQTITVQDTTAPELEIAADVTIECDQAVPAPEWNAEDNCSEDLTEEVTEVTVEGDCPNNYTIERTYSVTDECGNNSTAVQTITVQDTTAPEFGDFPADAEVECGNEVPVTFPTASDNCDDDVEITYSDAISTGGGGDGNFDGCTADFRAELGLNEDGPGAGDRLFEALGATIGAGVELDMDDEVENPNGWVGAVAVDLNGNDLSVYTTEVFEDIGGADFYYVRITIENISCGGISAVNVLTDDLLQDDPFTLTVTNTANSIEILWERNAEIIWIDEDGESTFEINADIACIPDNVITRTWTATDDCGNSTSQDQVLTIVDTVAPEFTSVPADVTIECSDDVPNDECTAEDVCSDVTVENSEQIIPGDCPGNYTIVRTCVATDACGNSSSASWNIFVQDTTAPELEIAADVTIECDQDLPAPAWTASDNCDEQLLEEITMETIAGDCPNNYTVERTYTVTDNCGNSTSLVQTITVQDTTAPELEIAPDVAISCDDAIPAPAWEAEDNCSETLTEVVTEVEVPGACPQSYSIERTYSVTDECGNNTSMVQVITITDSTAPEFTFVPQGNEFSCDEAIDYGSATAVDNCGDVSITFNDVVLPGNCPNNFTIERTWTATDECDNSAEATTFYYVYDATPPTFDGDVEDVNVECAGDVPATPELTASDNCGTASVEASTEILTEDECGNYTAVVTYTATDLCGNTATTSYNISVQDETAPVLSETPADLVVDCNDEVPAPADVTASDNCDDVEVVFTETFVGEMPNPDAVEQCNLISPISPFYNPDWALWLQDFPGGSYYTLLDGEFLTFEDGSATLNGTVVSVNNPEAGWDFSVLLENGLGWDEWSTQDFPTSYKDDFGVAGDEYLNWVYYIINSEVSTLTGWGEFEGETLSLSHAPSSFYYGYQVGTAANNVNSEFGSGGWIYYEGDFDGSPVSGAGDFAFNHDCCPDYSIVRTWTATDCSGNTVSHTQTITFGDLEEDPTIEAGDDNWSDVAVERENESITDIFPNPAVTKTTVAFLMDRDGMTKVEVFNLAGSKLAEVFNGPTEAGTQYRADIDVAGFADGIYLVRMSHNGVVTTDRLVISK